MPWLRITRADSIPAREGRSVRLGGMEIAIFNLGERFVAIENACPHRGGPLADGIVSSQGDGVTVTCPLHNWRISIEDGDVRKPSGKGHACVRTFDVKVENGIILFRPAPRVSETAA
ncbi:MAG: nitrite reductase small subunit NirD [Bryobacterales bacterium]|nr:nitrite reductase small subunit NirD [Bryobacterales bacterium]